jgi:hypothetical protein
MNPATALPLRQPATLTTTSTARARRSATIKARVLRAATVGLMAVIAACDDPTLGGDFSPEALAEEQLVADQAATEEAALTTQTTCTTVNNNRELMIRHLSVVNDPVRTTWNGSSTASSSGAWQFGRLMADMAGTREPAAFTRSLFEKWRTNQTVNGQIVPARTEIDAVLQAWPKRPDGVTLDLTKAPLRLLAIVNRIDLRNVAAGNAGEGRFVFGVLDGAGNPLTFTIILEYKLPATTQAEVLRWADDWHALGALDPATDAFKTRLQGITDRFSRRGAMPTRPNGSAIGQIRSNEIALAGPWELREFRLNSTGALIESTVFNTPAGSFNGSSELAQWINANEAAVLRETHTVPARLTVNGVARPFLGGAIENSIDFWSAPGIRNATARHKFSLQTCNGCHGAETNTFFLHVSPRTANQIAPLSAFMTGQTVADPVTGTTRQFNELARRNTDLRKLLCAPR